MDFINKAEESRITINNWVSDQTEEKIKDLIPQGAINAATRLVLTNAIYFNAAWQHPFAEEVTSSGTFHLLDNSDVTIPMMYQTESFKYAEGSDYQAVELPYDKQELSMVILLPREGQFEAFEESLNAEIVDEIIGKLEGSRVALTMPKFEYASSFSLKDALTTLGMGVAFTPEADFSGMNGSRDLFIGDVLHKAFVSVDEEGTEAAAASAVIMAMSAPPSQPIEFTVDRPFVFFIRDIQTSSIIFVGRVLNPSA